MRTNKSGAWAKVCLFSIVSALCLDALPGAGAGQSNAANSASATATVPRLVRFNGTLPERRGSSPAATAAARVTFSIYEEQAGGAALWSEVQDVRHDAQGRYSVLLGAASSDGLPAELFSTAGARWLGVQVEGRSEEARILLVAVPYALKAADADTLGGKPATAFVASDQLKEQVQSVVQAQTAQAGAALGARTLVGAAPTPQVIAETSPATFTCATSGVCVQTAQSGAGGIALRAVTSSPTSATAIFDNLAGGKILSGRTTGYAEKFYVDGSGNAWVGGSLTANSFSGTSGQAVFGAATAGSGTTYGVRGQSASPSGTGVFGYATSPTGLTYGLLGSNLSTSGTGLSGSASSLTGNTIGVRAVTQSPSSTAAIFDNLGGGKLISARTTGYAEKFSVSGAGNVAASGIFSGNGSGLTNVNAATLGGLLPAAFAPATGSSVYVAKAGDTMTGTLNLPANGLVAGTNQLVISGGNVGVGTAIPAFKLDVAGSGNLVDSLTTPNKAVVYATQSGVGATSPFPLPTDLAPAAVRGDATAATTNITHGVIGTSSGQKGRGVTGIAYSTTGLTWGVGGRSYSSSGMGVTGSALATTGFAIGVYGDTASPDGVAGIFSNYAGGQILSGDDGTNEVFSVMNNGDLNAAGKVTADSFAGDGSLLTNIPTTALSFSAATLGSNSFIAAQSITGSTAGLILDVTQSGTGSAISGSTSSTSLNTIGVFGQSTGTSGETYGVRGTTESSGGGSAGVRGDANGTSGETYGVAGYTSSSEGRGVLGRAGASTGQTFGVEGHTLSHDDSAAGVYGEAEATSGITSGVQGTTQSNSNGSSGVRGEATSTTATNFGVLGRSASTSGTGVRGEALNTTGANIGVHAESHGDAGIGIRAFVAESTATAGLFDNKGGGKILSGQNNATEVFSVAGSGNINTAGDLTVDGTGTSAFAGNVTIAGDLTVTGTFSNPSSRRWKTNVRPLENALATVAQLRGVSYDLKATGKHQIGVIAEEVAPLVPEVVSFEANGQDARGVDYARLTALLIEAVKEQQTQIHALKAELERLHAEMRGETKLASR